MHSWISFGLGDCSHFLTGYFQVAMKIHELPSQDMETPTDEALKRAEELVREIEEASPVSLSSEKVKKLRDILESFARAEFSEEQRVNAWRLSYRIWNTSVDMVNNLEVEQELTEDHAELRQVASDLLAVAGAIGNGARSSFLRIAMFFFKTGCTWHKIKKELKASVCFERAFELCFRQEGSSSQSTDTREQSVFFFDLSLARARTAWELGGQILACRMLESARGLLSTIPADRHNWLAELYLQFGKSLLLKDDTESQAESVRHMEIGLDICSEGISISQLHDDKTYLERQKQRILHNLAAGELQNENYESALRYVDVLRLTTDHINTSYIALRALAKLGRHDEVERELFTLVDRSRIDAVEKAFFILLEQFGPQREHLPAKILKKLLWQEPSGDPSCIKRVELALKIACDDKVLTALMAENEGLVLEDRRQQSNQKQQQSVHTLLWTR